MKEALNLIVILVSAIALTGCLSGISDYYKEDRA